ncbi:hypothetical protein SBA2_190003 [Acidobacteriia bacterium SbA2]|nr:hypothetical protein SBA2_190003 [Acidobacteriia bacterium SbA2]
MQLQWFFNNLPDKASTGLQSPVDFKRKFGLA